MFVSEDVDLGYAITAHRAQGVTVDTAHTLVTPSTTTENLYVSMTRGQHTNTARVAADRPGSSPTLIILISPDTRHIPHVWCCHHQLR
jgi:hypothetical protein